MNFRRRDRKHEGPVVPDEKVPEPRPTFQPRRNGHRVLSFKLILGLLVYFLVIIHYFERVRVKNAVNSCQWDNWEHWSGEKADVTPHRVAFIADPQLVDDHTYPKLPRLVGYLLRRMSDNYLHTNYKFMQYYLDPDTVIFLGDMFDGGREWDDKMWLDEYKRFNKIFPKKPNRRSIRSLPGNHDIGFQNVSTHNMERFAAYFGEANDFYELGNHTIVQLDTISMSHEDPAVHTQAREFLASLDTKINPSMPRMVLTHVPLYRDPRVETCDALRESSRPFPLQRGHQYQTVIDYSYTSQILNQLSPKIVFSGDDHDYCDMHHVDYTDNSKILAREISVKTASMTNGIKYPAIQLLSLNNPYDPNPKSKLASPDDTTTYKTMMCYMPTPYAGAKFYGLSYLVAVGILVACIVYPERIEIYLDKSAGSSSVLPRFWQHCMVEHEKHSSFRKRLNEVGFHSAILLWSILCILSLYNRR
ncbi:hypothetical protein FT663_02050 [Candidozyma haemuli var. vulneris]|uniref:Calcineurin-like phosphoesterase domain-containing protein n=1 Tax=Candidozyma haemuli TaxID=45357 RepID=A0A2V1AL02_9ASCO|nr:hypothetical protein CXQ85_001291 [[Candida] haemuloni]KAF3989971.1 hypothetical protein FT662_02535 [[Candida] haemuloni var. vulneris]KAF3993041.1 hypothetical protein FT663_02050 [[Candida] haemuloni var. vulneris]PVH18997.1 hypothetical protein CXQ85_001291 [[Candida] haemuloni]